MKKIKKSVKIITAVVLVIVLLLASGVIFYLSKLNLIKFSDGKFRWNGSIDTNDSETIDEQSRMNDAIADLEEKDAIDATGKIYKDKRILNILLIGTDEYTEEFSENARGDSCMIMSVGKKDGSLKLASLERGMGMPILDGKYKGQYDWLTHTFRYGGADLMMRAIRMAGLKPEDIGYINTHGTATPVGDPVELDSIKRVFNASRNVAINSTKSMTGHMIGAAGAVEAIFSTLMLERSFLCPTANLDDPADEFAWADLIRETRENVDVKHALSNSFGFGGSNACLVFSKWE